MAETINLKKGQQLTEKAAFLETALALAKVFIGLASGSMALISDAIHSGADLLTIFTSWLGLKIAQKKPDQKFPYGYYKAENIGSLIISVVILWAAKTMFVNGYSRLFSFSTVNLPVLALLISLADAIILFFFGRHEIKIGRQINSQSLIALGSENRTHLFSSLAVFLGTLAAFYRIPYLEGVVILIISFLIFQIGFSSAKQALFSLMDVSPGQDIENKVKKIIKTIAGIEDFFDLRLRQAGPFVYGQVKIAVRKSINVDQAHFLADQIETIIKDKIPTISSFSIHIEPFKTDFSHLIIPVTQKQGLSSSIAKTFARAPYFLFVNLKAKKIKGYYFLKNPYQKQSTKAGLSVAKFVIKQKSGVLLTQKIGEIAYNALHNNLVDVYKIKDQTAQKVIDSFSNRKLTLIQTPN